MKLPNVHSLRIVSLFLCVGFFIGVILACTVSLSLFALYCVGLGALVMVVIVRRNANARLLFALALFVVLGAMRVAVEQLPFDVSHIGYYNERGVITWWGYIDDEPELREDEQRIVVHAQKGLREVSLSGRVLITLPLYPAYNYGQRLKISCAIKTPFESEEFSYKKYLARKHIVSVCKNPSIELLPGSEGSWIYAALFSIKHFFLEQIKKYLSEPQVSLVGGLLIGERSGFPPAVTQSFSITGLSHIVAISGYNITIIIALIYQLLRRCSLGRKQSFWLLITGVTLFTLLTGAQAATVRASLMGCTTLLAQYLGRLPSTFHTLLLSALLMVVQNPLILLYDIGFQLSFLATVGLVYLSPLIERHLEFLPKKGEIKTIMAQTLAAILITAPLIIFYFKTFSVIAPLANLLILPTIPLVMALGFAWGVIANIAYVFHGVLDQVVVILASPIWLVTTYILSMTAWLSRIPFASVTVDLGIFRWGVVMLSYAALLVWYLRSVDVKKDLDRSVDSVYGGREMI